MFVCDIHEYNLWRNRSISFLISLALTSTHRRGKVQQGPCFFVRIIINAFASNKILVCSAPTAGVLMTTESASNPHCSQIWGLAELIGSAAALIASI